MHMYVCIPYLNAVAGAGRASTEVIKLYPCEIQFFFSYTIANTVHNLMLVKWYSIKKWNEEARVDKLVSKDGNLKLDVTIDSHVVDFETTPSFSRTHHLSIVPIYNIYSKFAPWKLSSSIMKVLLLPRKSMFF
jgi:hypothetical protein